jgi:exopolyphosphatase/guanosine-5'-triphosphate,3'-diphosphate pyrophosphatase
MPHIAAIDIGSNAIRFAMAQTDAAYNLQRVHSAREPIRLGQDVFDHGSISKRTGKQMIRAFAKFQRLTRRHEVVRVRAVATSAMREAHNRQAIIRRIARDTGIDIEVIDGREEAKLIFAAVARVLDLRPSLALLIDIGGGSVETTVCRGGRVIGTRSWPLGTVRLLEHLRHHRLDVRDLPAVLDKPLLRVRHFLHQTCGRQRVDLCIGTGGNTEALGKLRVSVLDQPSNRVVSGEDLDTLIRKLVKRSVSERIKDFDIRADRADVIVPAAMVLRSILRWTDADRLQVPRVALKDGMLWEMAMQLSGRSARTFRRGLSPVAA